MTNLTHNSERPGPALERLLDYSLSDELIAQTPIEPRDAARLLTVNRRHGSLADRRFNELPNVLQPGDLVIMNDTRVMPARIQARRASGGRVELLLLRPETGRQWRALARPARRLRTGEWLSVLDVGGTSTAQRIRVTDRDGDEMIVEADDLAALALAHGQIPLPPYIRDPLQDSERYQTVFARDERSAAAPTAGLHFTTKLLEQLSERNIQVRYITLHIGLGTFQSVRGNVYDHQMHAEYFVVPSATAAAIRTAKHANERIVAIGTTVTRTLETVASQLEDSEQELTGWSDLYIRPPYDFNVVDALVTNFHLPRTTLLLLVAAFTGVDLTLSAYEHAIQERYRFYSFGDAMLIV